VSKDNIISTKCLPTRDNDNIMTESAIAAQGIIAWLSTASCYGQGSYSSSNYCWHGEATLIEDVKRKTMNKFSM
jgi:hypothetical protein